MAVQQYKRAVGTFPSRREAEAALNELRSSGFPMDRVSVLAKEADRGEQIGGAEVKARGDNEAQEGAGIGAVAGTALGGVGGLLVGLEAILIPGAGPFLAAGTVATTLAGAGIGAATGSLVGALTGLGIPEEEAKVYDERVSRGDYLVIVDGSEADINRVGSILSNRGIRDWAIYDISDEYGSAPARSTNVDVAPVVNQTPDIYVDRTTTDRGVADRTTTDSGAVEIIDKRDEVR